MKNRAKCRLCNSILESFHRNDYVSCSCGEISIDGGSEYLRCSAKNWANFLRVDDEGNEIVVKVEGTNADDKNVKEAPPLTLKDKINMLDEMIKSFERLPTSAMMQPITHYDHLSALTLLREIFLSL